MRVLDAPSRIAGVDLARGLAVIGMLAAHLVATAETWEWADPSTWSSIVDGRSSILFATLAGVSLGLVSGGAVPLAPAARAQVRGRIGVRAGILWVIGVLLILTGVPVYVILPAYALLFLLALPLLGATAAPLLITAAALGMTMPWLQPILDELPVWWAPYGEEVAAAIGWNYPFTVWCVFVIAGLGIARCDLRRQSTQLTVFGIGVLLATAGYAFSILTPTDAYLQTVWQSAPHSSGLLEVIGSGGFAIAVIGACLLVCRVRAVRMLLLPLRATGAMPLTAYTGQIVAWAVVALVAVGDTGDLRGFRALEPFGWFVLVTVVFATAWMLLIGRGPLEMLLDRTARAVVPDRLER